MTTTTTLDSSSLAESTSMDNTITTTATEEETGRIGEGRGNRNDGEDVEKEEEGDVEVWSTFSKSFKQVQSVLDRNRALIQQVNENHRSKISDNLVKNVALIQEINGNILKVVTLYSDLSSDFSSMFHQRKESTNNSDEQLNDGSQ